MERLSADNQITTESINRQSCLNSRKQLVLVTFHKILMISDVCCPYMVAGR